MFELFAAWGQGCAACSRMIETSRPGLEGQLCLRCRQGLPAGLVRVDRPLVFVDEAWALGPYTGLLGGLVRSAKYGEREHLLAALGVELAEHVARSNLVVERGFDGVVCVPSTLGRRLSRGFDAVALLARALPGVIQAPMRQVLVRHEGARQAGQSHAERRANVLGMYTARQRVSGAWLLVDDVLTTGTTASACALALVEAGASSVTVLVIAGG